MTSTDNTTSSQKSRKELDAYHCGVIIGRYLIKQRPSHISRDLQIPRSTVVDCINRFKKSGSAVPKKRSGRPMKLSERDEKIVARIIKKAPLKTQKAYNEELRAAGINIHRRTFSKYAKRNGLGHDSSA